MVNQVLCVKCKQPVLMVYPSGLCAKCSQIKVTVSPTPRAKRKIGVPMRKGLGSRPSKYTREQRLQKHRDYYYAHKDLDT